MSCRKSTHGCNVRIRIILLVELRIVRSIFVHEIRIETFGAHRARFLEEIVVRIARIIVNAGLQLEHADREDRRFAMAEAFVDRVECLVDDEAACR